MSPLLCLLCPAVLCLITLCLESKALPMLRLFMRSRLVVLSPPCCALLCCWFLSSKDLARRLDPLLARTTWVCADGTYTSLLDLSRATLCGSAVYAAMLWRAVVCCLMPWRLLVRLVVGL